MTAQPHLLVETHTVRTPQGPECYRRGSTLLGLGIDTTVLLLENGVTAGIDNPDLEEFLTAGGTVRVDGFSLRQRGLTVDDLHPRLAVTGMDWLADYLLTERPAVVWH
ncbi:hypothetical protein [Haloglycomyces albus]|uniref:hypothetical protein n=1 Tax=Haloglycomyces albus TaxID=526067 RepID=UPI00046D0DDC|nr:hypothetical protein [Haloglycomyces albus]